MFFYVFNNQKWIETEKLYPHDIALILDQDDKKIHIWEGPRSLVKNREEATTGIDILKKKFPEFEFSMLGVNIPRDIQEEIEKRIDRSYEETQKFDRAPPYTGFVLACFVVLALLGVALVFKMLPWSWINIEGGQIYFMISVTNFDLWIGITSVAMVLVLIDFFVAFIFALLTKKIFLVMTSAVGFFVELGSYFLINLGVYNFEAVIPINPIQDFYNFSLLSVLLYSFLIVFGLISSLIPMIISIKAINDTTVPIPWAEWREKNKKVEFRMASISAFARRTTFLPFETESIRNFDKEKELKA